MKEDHDMSMAKSKTPIPQGCPWVRLRGTARLLPDLVLMFTVGTEINKHSFLFQDGCSLRLSPLIDPC